MVDEIKTTVCPAADITPDFAPEHWAQAIVYAAIYAAQHELEEMRVQLTYFQVDEELILRFERHYTAQQLQEEVEALLAEYAPWARRAVEWKKARNSDLQAMQFPFPAYRPGQRAMAGEVYKVCRDGGRLLCQAPTGIGKSMSVLFPALKSMGNESVGPIFYLTARGTTRTAAENALAILRDTEPELHLRSVTLTAKDKICLCETRECTPEACPYANGYYARIKGALWDVLDVPCLTAETLQEYAERHMVCPFELGLDSSLWSDVIIGDYNYLFDPVVHLVRFFESAGDYIFLVDEAHNLPGRAREMHSAALTKTSFYEAKKLLGKGKSSLKNALTKVNDVFIEWRHRAEEETAARDGRFGKTFFLKERSEEFDHLLNRLCEPLEAWLDDHREPDETHTALLQLYFDVRAWLRVADTFDDHLCCKSRHPAARCVQRSSALTPAPFWRIVLPWGAPRCCSVQRWPRPVIIRTCAACRKHGPLPCAAPSPRAIRDCSASAMSAPGIRTGMQALQLWRKAWRRWCGRAAGIIWRFSPVMRIWSRLMHSSRSTARKSTASSRKTRWMNSRKRPFWPSLCRAPANPCLALP